MSLFLSSTGANFVVGSTLEQRPGEVLALRQMVQERRLAAKRVDSKGGDVRYWGVDVRQSPVLERLQAFGEEGFTRRVGRRPLFSFVMVNRVDAADCPAGSGGGWHRDALTRQFKAFVYLTDVDRETQGAFCFIPGSDSLPLRACSALHRIASGGHRYSDRTMQILRRAGLRGQPVLLKSGIPFFVKTSLIHRGLPITEGARVAATLYMCENVSAEFADLRTVG